jgi:hypothetical protein
MPEQFDLHHREVQEIMGRMPGWVTRWASTGLLGSFLVLGFTARLVRFPDEVPAAVIITQGPAQAPRIQVRVAVEQAAAIRPGQAVLIDLQAYPARLYGYLPATVSQVLPFTTASVVEVRVAAPASWRTTTGQAIAYQPVLKGVGTIIVSESTLLQRVFRR